LGQQTRSRSTAQIQTRNTPFSTGSRTQSHTQRGRTARNGRPRSVRAGLNRPDQPGSLAHDAGRRRCSNPAWDDRGDEILVERISERLRSPRQLSILLRPDMPEKERPAVEGKLPNRTRAREISDRLDSAIESLDSLSGPQPVAILTDDRTYP